MVIFDRMRGLEEEGTCRSTSYEDGRHCDIMLLESLEMICQRFCLRDEVETSSIASLIRRIRCAPIFSLCSLYERSPDDGRYNCKDLEISIEKDYSKGFTIQLH